MQAWTTCCCRAMCDANMAFALAPTRYSAQNYHTKLCHLQIINERATIVALLFQERCEG